MNKLFVISDIHGCYDIAKRDLLLNGYDENNDNHLLIVLGDIFDRGMKSKEIFEWLYDLSINKKAIVIKGNHEEMLISFLNSNQNFNQGFYNFGMRETIISFCGEDYDFIKFSEKQYDNGAFVDWDDCFSKFRIEITKVITTKYPSLLKWLESLPYYYETDNYIFTHASIDTTIIDWKNSDWKQEVWDNGSFIIKDCNNIGNKKIIVGHYSTDDLRKQHNIDIAHIGNFFPLYYKNKVFIDSNVIESKKMNVIIL